MTTSDWQPAQGEDEGRTLRKHMRRVYCLLFPAWEDARIVLHDAAITVSAVDASGGPERFWFAAIEQAHHEGGLPALHEQVVERYPGNESVQRITGALFGEMAPRQSPTTGEVELRRVPLPFDVGMLDRVLGDLEFSWPERPPEPIAQVDLHKLDFNEIGVMNRELVASGWRFERYLRQYFSRRRESDPEVVERIAEVYRTLYRRLVDRGLHPRVIFQRLWQWTAQRGDAAPHVVASILAYFFDRCDIFENAPPTFTAGALPGQSESGPLLPEPL